MDCKENYGQFARDMEDKDKNNTWRWMRKSDLKGCTEALICSSQKQSIRTNYIKYNINKTGKSPLCRICSTRNETVSHAVSECGKLAKKGYKRIPIVVGALGTIKATFDKYIESLGIEIRIEHVQKSVLIGTAKIIRKVLSC